MKKPKDIVISFRIDRNLLERFDELCRSEGVYIRSEGLRKAVISVLKRGRFDS